MATDVFEEASSRGLKLDRL